MATKWLFTLKIRFPFGLPEQEQEFSLAPIRMLRANGIPVSIRRGAISGSVYVDQLRDSVLGVGDAPLAGVSFFLDANLNERLDFSESRCKPIKVASLVRRINRGRIIFGRVVAPPDFESTSSLSQQIYISAGAVFRDLDFWVCANCNGRGQFENGQLSGTLFRDDNNDGFRQSAEKGLSA